MAVDHYNTGHPHSHIIIRGKAEDGKELIIAKDYITHGIRARACEWLTLELGPEDEFEKVIKLARDVQTERFTRLDRSILKHVDQGILVISSMPPVEPQVHASQMRRLHAVLDRRGLVKHRKGRKNKAVGTVLSNSEQPNDQWCADYTLVFGIKCYLCLRKDT